jgi:hypothetical protein
MYHPDHCYFCFVYAHLCTLRQVAASAVLGRRRDIAVVPALSGACQAAQLFLPNPAQPLSREKKKLD